MKVQQVPKKEFALMYCQQPWDEIQRFNLYSYIFLLADFKVKGWSDDVGARISPTMQRIGRILSHHGYWEILSKGNIVRGICPNL